MSLKPSYNPDGTLDVPEPEITTLEIAAQIASGLVTNPENIIRCFPRAEISSEGIAALSFDIAEALVKLSNKRDDELLKRMFGEKAVNEL